MNKTKTISWKHLHTVPAVKGIYAWYYRPDITEFDVKTAIDTIKQHNTAGQRDEAIATAEEFFIKRIFGYFRYESYKVDVSGPLMPSFSGSVDNEQGVSQSFLQRIVDDPERLREIHRYMRDAAPLFSSPLYVGKSDSLKARLATHQNLIMKYRAVPSDMTGIGESDDTSFAKRVVSRGIPPERLFVVIYEIDTVESIHVDIEHIFNRICYPILGRN
jgi:hypothetical protein